MGELKLTKSELRAQQQKLTQLQKYLPTLQLKKSLLQSEVNEARAEIVTLENTLDEVRLHASTAAGLMSVKFGRDLSEAARVQNIAKEYENIAGVNIPLFRGVEFVPFEYELMATPHFIDSVIEGLRQVAIAKAKIIVAQEKKNALEKELREVTIRVNLFEKNLIPSARKNIQKIKVFLGDQQLAAIAQAKVAKRKILR